MKKNSVNIPNYDKPNSGRWRCTFPSLYPPGTLGHEDPSARQGYYVDAVSEKHAAECVSRMNGDADISRGVDVQDMSVEELSPKPHRVFLIQNIAFPEAWKMSDLFLEIKPWPQTGFVPEIYKDIWVKDEGILLWKREGKRSHLSPYMTRSEWNGGRHESAFAVVKPEVVEFIRANMIFIEHDSIYFSAVVRKDNQVNISAIYNQIIGSRCLGIVSNDM